LIDFADPDLTVKSDTRTNGSCKGCKAPVLWAVDVATNRPIALDHQKGGLFAVKWSTPRAQHFALVAPGGNWAPHSCAS
jgi:hypothetical protein